MQQRDKNDLVRLSRRTWFLTYALIGFLLVLGAAFVFRKPPPYEVEDRLLLGTHIRVAVSSQKNPSAILDAIWREMRRIEAKYSSHVSQSEVSRINAFAPGKAIPLDEETLFLFERALEWSRVTAGAFDIALGNLVSAWGFDRVSESDFSARVPTQAELEAALSSSGWQLVEISGQQLFLQGGVQLDLGAFVKGYAVDRAVQVAKGLDPECTGYVDAGGDIGIIGPKFGGANWVVQVQNPRPTSQDFFEAAFLNQGAIATSGDYERFFLVEGKRYHHILDPFSGYPSTRWISVTVIAPSALDADALATAAFNMEREQVMQLFPRFGAQALLVDSQGDVYKTPGWAFFSEDHP